MTANNAFWGALLIGYGLGVSLGLFMASVILLFKAEGKKNGD